MSISPARLVAFRILCNVEQKKGTASELLHSEITASLNPRDQALTTQLVYGVFRQRNLIDKVLARHSNRSLDKLDLPVIVALRLGAYQRLFLSRIPAWAAIYDSVELVKQARMRSAASFTNAVLRGINLDTLEEELSSLDQYSDSSLAIRFSHPDWLIRRWKERFDEGTILQLLKLNNETPATFFRANDLSSGQLTQEELGKQGIEADPHPVVDSCWQLHGGDLLGSSLFQKGGIVLQDPASQIIPILMEPQPGDYCLDLCSAPGGKSSQIACLTKGKATVIGMDVSWQRVMIAKKLHGCHWPNLIFLAADGCLPLPFSLCFDRILLDAPCSGTGTLRRNPDIRWRLSPSDFARQSSLQFRLLENSSRYLKPGGTLVYSTCSLEAEENEEVVDWFVQRSPMFSLELPTDVRLHRFFNLQKFFRWPPSNINNDGFFAVILRKRQDVSPI